MVGVGRDGGGKREKASCLGDGIIAIQSHNTRKIKNKKLLGVS